MEGTSAYPAASILDSVHRKKKDTRLLEQPTINMMEDACQNSIKSGLSSQLPLQMHNSQHLVYQSYPHTALVRSPEEAASTSTNAGQAAASRYMPVQQQPTAMLQHHQTAHATSTLVHGNGLQPAPPQALMGYATSQNANLAASMHGMMPA